ncbi:MAG: hypothetical protein QM756_37620 [Polyangiaceae bacterium]
MRSWQTRVFSQKSGLSPSKSGQKNAIVETFPAYSFAVLEVELEPSAPKPPAAPAKAPLAPARR